MCVDVQAAAGMPGDLECDFYMYLFKVRCNQHTSTARTTQVCFPGRSGDPRCLVPACVLMRLCCCVPGAVCVLAGAGVSQEVRTVSACALPLSSCTESARGLSAWLHPALLRCYKPAPHTVPLCWHTRRGAHDWSSCPYAHPKEKARRRDPRVYKYASTPCPESLQGVNCGRGVECPYAHSVYGEHKDESSRPHACIASRDVHLRSWSHATVR